MRSKSLVFLSNTLKTLKAKYNLKTCVDSKKNIKVKALYLGESVDGVLFVMLVLSVHG